jgi:hypothetical protein
MNWRSRSSARSRSVMSVKVTTAPMMRSPSQTGLLWYSTGKRLPSRRQNTSSVTW